MLQKNRQTRMSKPLGRITMIRRKMKTKARIITRERIRTIAKAMIIRLIA